MSGAGLDEMSLASEEAKRWERDQAEFEAQANAWWNARWLEMFKHGRGGDAIMGLYNDHLQAEADQAERRRLAEENQRLRTDLAEITGKLQRLTLLTANLVAIQKVCDEFDQTTKEPER